MAVTPYGETVLLKGADGFLAKPVANLAAFQAAILCHLPKPRLVRGDSAHPSSLATAPPG
ncbi:MULTISPECIES: hypothetical protein [unclassified Yoonia]|uniref:hypothetical protein n=1 Tax=unclassified Yoonia TaxID=2629118 RepID=UPI002AFF55E7|nr:MULTISPECIES: hypothetical protein [unclassified Yoonia]